MSARLLREPIIEYVISAAELKVGQVGYVIRALNEIDLATFIQGAGDGRTVTLGGTTYNSSAHEWFVGVLPKGAKIEIITEV